MLRALIAVGLLSLAVSSCAGSGRLHGDPLPEGAENPISLRFRSATIPDAIDIAAQVVSNMGITPLQVDRSRGYLETSWIDIAAYERSPGAYPARERRVQFQFRVTEEANRVRKLELATVYRPHLADRDRLVPLDHPGFTRALKMEEKFRLILIGRNATLVKPDEG